MDGILTFGKHSGKSYSKVLEEDLGYAEWALKKLKNSTIKNQLDFYNYVDAHYQKYKDQEKERSRSDKDLKQAWYNHPKATLLLSYELDPSFEDVVEKNVKYLIGFDVDTISPRKFIQSLNEDIVNGWLGTPYEIQAMKTDDLINHLTKFVLTHKGRSYYVREDILEVVLELRECWYDNQENDRWYSYVDQPSKVILEEFLYPFKRPLKTDKVKTPRGRWLLYFDNLKMDKTNLTELDRCYQILKDNYDSISQDYIFRASTKRYQKLSYGKGVIEIFCNEEDRDKIIRKIDDLLYLDTKVGWRLWSDDHSRYHYEPKLLREKETLSIWHESSSISEDDLNFLLQQDLSTGMAEDLKEILERETLFNRLVETSPVS